MTSARAHAAGLPLMLVSFLCLPLVAVGCGPTPGAVSPQGGPHRFVHRQGARLLEPDGSQAWLRGIAFGNEVWSDKELPTQHHDGADYARVAKLNMNTVRFYLHYRTLEDDDAPGRYKDSGWAWLDQNVAWAKQHGIRLVFNMHAPQGGYQSGGKGNALWEQPELQARLAATWRAIAKRYAHEPAVAGYDILNEPRVPAGSTKARWQTLAQRLVKSIREVDADHLIFVERLNSIGEDWGNDADHNFILVDDPQVVYEFHFYSPHELTHQGASWVSPTPPPAHYPDPSKLRLVGEKWLEWNWNKEPPSVPAGDSDWKYYESQPFVPSHPELKVLSVALMSELNAGTVYFDDVVVKEHAPDGSVKELLRADLESLDHWYFWKEDGSQGAAEVSPEHHSGKGSLLIRGTTHDASLTNQQLRFVPKPGFAYSVGGWMKGVQVPAASRPDPRCAGKPDCWPQKTRALIRLDSLGGSSLTSWDAAGLAADLEGYLKWGEQHQVPLFLGEWGCISGCFAKDETGVERGGTQWTKDVLSVIRKHRLHATWHAFKEGAFGLYQQDGPTTDAALNRPLAEALKAGFAP